MKQFKRNQAWAAILSSSMILGQATPILSIEIEDTVEEHDILSHGQVENGIPDVENIVSEEGTTSIAMIPLDSSLVVGTEISTFSTSQTCGENLTWSLENGVLTISGTGEMDDWEWGLEQGYLSPSWYLNSSEITSVVIQEGVTTIGDWAFYECKNLTSVTLPDSLLTIGRGAFWNGNLTELVIPEGVTHIETETFYFNSNLTDVTLPSTLLSIGYEAFYGCDVINNVTYGGSESDWAAINIVGGEIDTFNGSNFTFLGTGTNSGTNLSNCGDNLTWDLTNGVLTISGTGDMYDWRWDSVMESYENPPWEENKDDITSVVIENGVTSIGDIAFNYCTNLTTVSLPSSITSIGASAFNYCTNLTTISLPSGITSIGASAFNYCTNLTTISLPSGITSIGDYALNGCSSLTTLTLPDTLITIGVYAFAACNIASIDLPAKVENIALNAFDYCSNLKDFFVDSSNLNYSAIDGVLFNKDAKTLISYPIGRTNTSYTIPNTVETIGLGAFSNALNLYQINIPSSVKTIGEHAFSNSGIISITIPSSVENIGALAFYWCKNLVSIEYENGIVSLVPFVDTVEKGANFSGCSNLEYVSIPKSVTSISPSLYDYSALSHIYYEGSSSDWAKIVGVNIADTVLGDVTIHYNETKAALVPELVEVKVGDGVNDYITFEKKSGKIYGVNKNLVTANIPNEIDGIAVIGISDRVFSYHKNLKYLTLPDSMTELFEQAFHYCTALEEVTISGNMQSIAEQSFAYCTNLTKVTLLEGVEIIEHATFYNCSSLIEVNIPKTVIEIRISAFNGCSAITDVYYTGSTTDWESISVANWNTDLTNATIHYNYVLPENPEDDNTTEPDYNLTPSLTLPEGTEYEENSSTDVILNSDGTLNSLPTPSIKTENDKLYYAEGWHVDGERVTSDTVFTEDTMLEIKWVAVPDDAQYYIYLDFNLLDYDSTNIAFADQYGKIIGTLPDLDSDTAFHLGWEVVENSTARSLTDGDSFTQDSVVTDSVIITPIFQDIYTVTFNGNGGVVNTSTLITGRDATLLALPTPTRTNYTFNGWYTASSGGGNVTLSTEFKEDTTIYAQWTAVSTDSNQYKVSATSGSNGTISPSGIVYVTESDTKVFTFTPDSGYEVDKVTVNGSAVTVSGDSYTMQNVTSDSTIHVTFKSTSTSNPSPDTTTPAVTYTVTFYSNGGSSVSNQTTSTSGLLSSLPSSSRTNYTFNGWYTASSGGTKITTSTAFTKNTTVYAQWTYVGSSSSSSGSSTTTSTPTTYTNTVTTPENGTVKLNPTTPEYGDNVTLIVTPNSGYEVESVSVKRTSNGSEVTVTKNTDGTYSFTQPYGRAYVEVEFVKIGSNTNTETATPQVETTPEVTTTPSTTPRFSDISSSDWFYNAVEFVSEKGLMNGTGEGNFSPYDSTTRGMVVTVLHSLAGYPEPSAQPRFHDVESGEWFANAVTWANENQVANGVGEDNFNPNGNMTREQLVVMLYGYEKQFGKGEYDGELYLAFNDNDTISEWAEEAVAWSVAMGIVGGRDTGDFDPQATANRAEVAIILQNFSKLYG